MARGRGVTGAVPGARGISPPSLTNSNSLNGLPPAGGPEQVVSSASKRTSESGGAVVRQETGANPPSWQQLLSHLHQPRAAPRPAVSAESNPSAYSDSDDDMSASSKYPTMAEFKHTELDLFLTAVLQLGLNEPARKGVLTVEGLKLFLDALPVRGSDFRRWYDGVKDTLIAAAAAHHQVAVPGAAGPAAAGQPALTATQLFDYYEHLLTQYFKAAQLGEYQRELSSAVQGHRSPKMFKDQLLELERKLPGHVGNFQVAERFVQGLHPKVREAVQRQLTMVSKEQWYARLNQTAAEAEVVWNNLPDEERQPVEKKPVKKGTGDSAPAPKAQGTYYCTHHGYNMSHDTASCNALRSSTKKSALATLGLDGPMFEQLIALATQASGRASAAAQAEGGLGPSGDGGSNRPQRPGGSGMRGRGWAGAAGSGGGRGGPRCTYCGDTRHSEDRCFIKNPELAPPGYVARNGALQAMFEANKAKLAAQGGAASRSNPPRNQPARGAVAAVIAALSQVHDDFAEDDPPSVASFATVGITHFGVARGVSRHSA